MLKPVSDPVRGFVFVQIVFLILRMCDEVDAGTTAMGVLKILWHLILLLCRAYCECTDKAYYLTAFIGDFIFSFSLFARSCHLITVFNEVNSELRREKPDFKLYESLFLVFMMVTMGIDIWIIHSWWKGVDDDYKEMTPSPTPRYNSTSAAPYRPPPGVFGRPRSLPQLSVRRAKTGYMVLGIKEEHIVCNDGRGGVIVAGRSMTSGYAEQGDVTILHITREAILDDPDNPDVRVINEREVLTMSISGHDRRQIRALMN